MNREEIALIQARAWALGAELIGRMPLYMEQRLQHALEVAKAAEIREQARVDPALMDQPCTI